jgi:small subunit ribosomal protein S6
VQKYESIFIAPVELSPQKLDDLIEKLKGIISKNGGEFKAVDKWGRRRLAYPIDRNREGFYVLLTFEGPGPILGELTQFYRVNDDVIRHMTCKAPVFRPVPPRRGPLAPGATTVTAPAAATATKEATGDKPAPSTPA